jgi:hypothetical protein
MAGMTRRLFLRTVSALGLFALSTPIRCGLVSREEITRACVERRTYAQIDALLSEVPHASELGQAYLDSTHSTEIGIARLSYEIAAIDPRERGRLGRALRERIDGDFAYDRTVVVDGWLLAETEAQLFALRVRASRRSGNSA